MQVLTFFFCTHIHQLANTPNIDRLLDTATYSFDSWALTPTDSGPEWSTIVTGVWHNKHGVRDNSFSNKNYDEFPAWFKYARDAGLTTASVSQWNPINQQVCVLISYNDYFQR